MPLQGWTRLCGLTRAALTRGYSLARPRRLGGWQNIRAMHPPVGPRRLRGWQNIRAMCRLAACGAWVGGKTFTRCVACRPVSLAWVAKHIRDASPVGLRRLGGWQNIRLADHWPLRGRKKVAPGKRSAARGNRAFNEVSPGRGGSKYEIWGQTRMARS